MFADDVQFLVDEIAFEAQLAFGHDVALLDDVLAIDILHHKACHDEVEVGTVGVEDEPSGVGHQSAEERGCNLLVEQMVIAQFEDESIDEFAGGS